MSIILTITFILGKYNYVIDIVPCVDHVIQLYAKNNEGISYFDGFANTIPASSAEDISRSTYVLQTPTNARHETVNSGDSVVVYWDPVQCAKSYGVEFRGADETITKTSDETKYEMTELDQCSEYDIYVYAIIEDVVFSDFSDAGTVQTLPSVKAGSKIDPQVTATQNSVHISWNGHSALSCVDTYLVTLCPLTGECHEPAQVRRDVHMSSVDFTADGLDTCTDYDVTIKPEYPDMNIVPQEFSFHTAFPDPAELVSELGNVTAVSGANQQVTVSWSSVSCAPTYNVYQYLLDGNSDWELVGSTDKESLEFAGVPCTEYKYGVRVVLDGEQSDIVETEDSVVTPLAGDAFYPPKLEINSYPTRFDFSWDHASCISSYNVQLCTLGGECQVTDPVISDDGHVDTSFPDLEFCSDYSLKISASTGDNVLPGETITVRTVAPHPAAPENLNYELNDKANAIKLSYDPVVCATGYKIYQILEGDQTEVVTETNDNIVSLDSPPPCSDFR